MSFLNSNCLRCEKQQLCRSIVLSLYCQSAPTHTEQKKKKKIAVQLNLWSMFTATLTLLLWLISVPWLFMLPDFSELPSCTMPTQKNIFVHILLIKIYLLYSLKKLHSLEKMNQFADMTCKHEWVKQLKKHDNKSSLCFLKQVQSLEYHVDLTGFYRGDNWPLYLYLTCISYNLRFYTRRFLVIFSAALSGTVIFTHSKCVYKTVTGTHRTVHDRKLSKRGYLCWEVPCFKREARDTDQYLNMMERCLLTTMNTGLWKSILSYTAFSLQIKLWYCAASRYKCVKLCGAQRSWKKHCF